MNFRNPNYNKSTLGEHKEQERIIPFLTGFALGIPFGGRPNYYQPVPFPIYNPWFYPRYPRRHRRRFY